MTTALVRTTPVGVPAESNLRRLARQINREHQRCQRAFTSGMMHAIRTGKLLLEAKALCPYGTWLTWLTENFASSQRTAQAYMRVARAASSLPEDAQRVAHFAFRELLKMLATPAEEGGLPWYQELARQLDVRLQDMACRISEKRALWAILEVAPPSEDTLVACAVLARECGHLQNEAADIKLQAERAAGRLLNELADQLGCKPEVITRNLGQFISLCDKRIHDLEGA